jgi:glucose/arabinose dehydrogenase
VTLRPIRRRPRAALALAGLTSLAALALVACGSDDDGTDATPVPTASPADDTTPQTITADEAGGFEEPIALVVRPGDDALWLAERPGTVRRVSVASDGTLAPIGEPVLDLTDLTTTESERGLLGLAFDDDGDTLFVSHTDVDGNSDVASYPVAGEAVDVDARRVLFEVDQPYSNHNGGHIAFGPDGRLWLGLGDGGAADDPENRAQDDATPLGKLVAIDLDTGEAEQVAKGLRNPWRFAFDADGGIWIADVGQGQTEEINHVAADDLPGTNFGWSGYEGSTPYLDGEGRRPAEATPPVFEYGRDDGSCSVTGGVVYSGSAFPELDGAFLFADYCAGRVRAVQLGDDGKATSIDLGVTVANPISFGTDADGEVYVLSQGGEVVRLTAG